MDDDRFARAVAAFDAANAEDPHTITQGGETAPKELLYARQMTAWLDRLAPEASETLKLAARCQHIRRWAIPRDDYPKDRTGYLRWRTDLKNFHAEHAGEILMSVGYDDATIARVKALLRKQRLKRDPESQLLEDVVCLVFLENTFLDFSRQHDDAKVIDIVRKTWDKMSSAGHDAALTLDLPAEARRLVAAALAEDHRE
jgi:hypothetical protein